MAWTEHPRVVALRTRSGLVDVVVGTLDGYRRHRSGRNAAVLTYYGFLTLFPLFLAATTVLGFLLESRPEWRDDLIGSAVESVPFIGRDLATGSRLEGSWPALVIGLLGALWGSMRAFLGIQAAYDDVWEVALDDRANVVRQRLRALIGLAVIGGSQVATVALAALVSEASLPGLGRVALVLGGLVVNVAVIGTMYRFLTSATIDWSTIRPGTWFTAVLFTALQFGGTAITTRLLDSAETYGDFAGVLALLSWLGLHATVNLFGAELNAALVRRRTGVTPAA